MNVAEELLGFHWCSSSRSSGSSSSSSSSRSGGRRCCYSQVAVGMRSSMFRHSRHFTQSVSPPPTNVLWTRHGGSIREAKCFCSVPASVTTTRNKISIGHHLERINIFLPSYDNGGHKRAICPKCKGGMGGGKTLAVDISLDGELAMWNCIRTNCLNKGSLRVPASSSSVQSISESKVDRKMMSIQEDNWDITSRQKGLCEEVPESSYSVQSIPESKFEKKIVSIQEDHRDITSRLKDPGEEVLYYFDKRKISKKTLIRNGVKETYNHQGAVIAFPYKMNGEVVNCKYRTMGKMFWQEKQCLKVLYGLDDIVSQSEIIIVEGEIDKLSLEEAGFFNCVSVPDGAPPKVSEKSSILEEEDKKFSYIWNCKDYFSKASRIILATDADGPGQALAEELARRLGRERCWRVQWPKTKDGKKQLKDANEVLVELGPDELRFAIDTAELYPIRGLFTFSDFFKDLDNYFCAIDGDETGVSTGWPSLDDYYKVVPGELTLVTGVPGSGKSEWIDALMVNLVQLKGWTFGLCSMENKVREHGRKLLEKYWKKPFFNAIYSENRERITPEELEIGKQWMNDNFFLIRCEDDEVPSVDWVLKLAKAAVMRHGIRGLVIDPYNELDHQRGSQQTETEYVSKMLTKIKRFAQHHGCHVWFVAHPKQMQFWHGEAPNLYDISGSAHFVNKCDNGLVVHRNRDPTKGPLDRVEIFVRKARNKVSGTLGEATLVYDRVTGLYSDCKQIVKKTV